MHGHNSRDSSASVSHLNNLTRRNATQHRACVLAELPDSDLVHVAHSSTFRRKCVLWFPIKDLSGTIRAFSAEDGACVAGNREQAEQRDHDEEACIRGLSAGSINGQIAVVIEPARAADMAPLTMRAHGLTERESQVTHLLTHGLASREMAGELGISELTIQEHLKGEPKQSRRQQ
jgi:hypothetical protein